jgi:hypothetical protein
MKKYTYFILIGITLIGISCVEQVQNEVTPISSATELSTMDENLSTPRITETPILKASEKFALVTPDVTAVTLFTPGPDNVFITNYQGVESKKVKDRIEKDEREEGLSIAMQILNVKLSDNTSHPSSLVIYIEIKNTSDHVLVFKIPRRIGFEPFGSIEPAFDHPINDIELRVKKKDGTPTETGATSELLSPEYSTHARGGALENLLYHRPENFGEIKSSETISFIYTCDISVVVINKDYSGANMQTTRYKIPSGVYLVNARYVNFALGYYYPVQATPEISLETLASPNSTIADINAWVGTITSNDVEFSVP